MSNFKIIISKDGKSIKVEVDGIQGAKCTDLTKIFEDMGSLSSSDKKAEYYIENPDILNVGV